MNGNGQMIKRLLVSIWLILLFVTYPAVAQTLRINEVMSSNSQTISDEDGDTPDWVELYNGGEAVNLQGYTLSDSGSVDAPWIFPDMEIGAGEYVLLFASDKDRKQLPLKWETVIDWGDEWRYMIPNENIPQWNMSDYDDTSWAVGMSGFGYGDDDDNTEVSHVMSIFLRTTFEVGDPEEVEEILFHIDYDDAFVAYINGVEIARANITSNGAPYYNQPADNYDHEAGLYQGGQPDLFRLDDVSGLLMPGTNVLAVQVHNHSAQSSDLTAIPFLTLGRIGGEASLSEHLTTGTRYLHTHFKLSSDGEFLLFKNPAGELIDSVFTRSLPTDVSLGKPENNENNWLYFSNPTPGKANSSTGYSEIAGEVSFSKEGGLFGGSTVVELSAANPGGTIRYTTDGSLPAISGKIYSEPLTITSTTVLRAQITAADMVPGPVNTQTYLINTDHDIAILSLTTHPDHLWDYNEGIYVLGPNAEEADPHFGANFWQDWEKPVHIEMYEPSGELAFAQDAGMKIFGAWSRAHAQKSLSIHARKSYGNDQLQYQIFDRNPLDEFSSLVLRNSGNDWNHSMFRDALMTSLFNEDVDKQAYRPAVIYINGEYWGIHNIREKVNEDFLASHHQLDADSITILEADAIPVEGDESAYKELMNFVAANDLASESNYRYVADRVDIHNYIHYQIGNIFIDNRDWPGNNIKYWKSSAPGSKWRWIAYDTDFGFAIYDGGASNYNTLRFAKEPFGPDWPNPPWSTLLFRKLLDNENFRHLFINAFADQLNTALATDNILQEIEKLRSGIVSEIDAHLSRWGGSRSFWQDNIDRMKDFARQRPAIMRQHIRSEFNLEAVHSLTLEVNSEAFGEIKINTIQPDSYPWSGAYFQGVPVVLEAKPKPGYSFLYWEGGVISTESTVQINLEEAEAVRAVFEEANSELTSIVINEINYNPSKDFDTEDWVELYNKGSEEIDLSGWVLKDNDDSHSFLFEEGTSLGSGEFLVVCRNQEAFSALIAGVKTVGDMDFGLSGDGDCVRLYNADAVLTDEVCYLPDAPWPSVADGKGGTLALKNPSLDNADAKNWYGKGQNGNPGESNEVSPDFLATDTNVSLDFKVVPNPVSSKAQVTYVLKHRDYVSLALYDNSGKLIKQLHDGLAAAGRNQVTVSLDQSLLSGVYLLHLHGAYVNASVKIIVP